jgi:prevent-host-death family protein
MTTYTITEAQDRLPELIDRARNGEGIVITRDGAPIAEIRSANELSEAPSKPIDIDWLRRHLVGKQASAEEAGALVSRMRDDEWNRF